MSRTIKTSPREVGSRATAAGEFDFADDLPPDSESFSLHWLAKRWKCSVPHVINLVEAGEFNNPKSGTPVDLRGAGSSKSMIRIPRGAVVAFLNRRKDLAQVAESNPQPKYRSHSA